MGMGKVLPSKGMVIPMVVVVCAVLLAYNRIPKVAALLGNPNKG